MENYIKTTNGTLTEDERNATLKLTNSPSLDFQVSELIDSKIENKITVKDDSSLDNESKTPTFWPYPFASGGWLMSYIIVNSVLMGLYIFLAWPYFITGRIVDRIVMPSDSTETTTSKGTLSESALDEMEQKYMGYTSYGDSDMLMSYMMSDDDKDAMKENETNGKTGDKTQYSSEVPPQEDQRGSGETKDDESTYSNSNNNNNNNNDDNNTSDLNSNLGKEKYNKVKESKTTDDNQSSETENDNKIEDNKDDHTKCIENIMCLRPVYGARALSSASLALKLLEWIPGADALSIGRRFKRNVSRFGRAIEKGKINDCYDYLCPKDKNDNPTR